MAQRYFQWIAGERRGEVVVFDQITEEGGDVYIDFKDGTRINTVLIAEINDRNLTGKMVAEVENPNNIWQFKEKIVGDTGKRTEQDWESQEVYDVPSVEEIMADANGGATPTRKKVIELVPPRITRNKFGKIVTSLDLAEEDEVHIVSQPRVQQMAPVKPAGHSGDPVYIMMDKAKKVDTEVNMTLTISLPSSHLFDVVRDSFDDGGEKALEYIIENIDISDIKTALKEGIKEMYGPNDDPEDNKIISGKWGGEYDGTQVFEPACVEEPIIRDEKDGDPEFEGLKKELQEKAEKINKK